MPKSPNPTTKSNVRGRNAQRANAGPHYAFDINKMPRSRPAWESAITLLNDSKWHHYCEIVWVMLQNSDIQPHTCSQLLSEMLKQELIVGSEDKRWYSRMVYAELPDVSTFRSGVHTPHG